MQRNIALDDSAVPAVVEPPHVWLSTLHSFEIGDFRFVVLKLLISAYVDFASHVASSSLLRVAESESNFCMLRVKENCVCLCVDFMTLIAIQVAFMLFHIHVAL
jgi:hypothetical protein